MKKIGLILGKVGSGLGLVSPIFLLVLLVWNYMHPYQSMGVGVYTFLSRFSLTHLLYTNFGLQSSSISAILVVSQLFFILLGVLGIVYDRKNSKIAGILLIVAGVGFAFTSGLDYFVATPLLLAAGVLLLLQRGKTLQND
jgi:hypothetical protein